MNSNFGCLDVIRGLIGGFVEIVTEEVESLKDASKEKIAGFCDEYGLSAIEIMAMVNQSAVAIRKEVPSYDPKRELGNIVSYLYDHGYAYDEDAGIFREK